MHGVFLEPPRLYDPFKALSKELFEKFFAFTSKPIRELKSQLKGEQQYNTNFAYAYSSLREFRLVKLSYQGVHALVCPLMTLLYWRFTSGLYYEFIGVPEFASEFGDGFQNYVGEVVECACPDPMQRFSDQEYGDIIIPLLTACRSKQINGTI